MLLYVGGKIMLVTIGKIDVNVTNEMSLDEIEDAMIEASEKNKRLEQEENGKKLAMQGVEYIIKLQIDTDK